MKSMNQLYQEYQGLMCESSTELYFIGNLLKYLAAKEAPEVISQEIKPKRNAVIITYVDNKPVVGIECKDEHMEDFLRTEARSILGLLRSMEIANITLKAIDQAHKGPVIVEYICKAGNVTATFTCFKPVEDKE